LALIKLVKEKLGFGLKESKELVEKVPSVLK
jgi:ribosomal protein L7/L12